MTTWLTHDPQAVALRSIDLTRPLQGLEDVADYARTRLLVTWGSQPLGLVELANHHRPIGEACLRQAVVSQLGVKLLQVRSMQGFGPPQPGTVPTAHANLPAHIAVSIVVATYDRPDDLRACLRYLTQQASPRAVEIIVVDNHPSSGVTPPVVAEFPNVVLLQEPQQGLARARNRGFRASHGDILVTTDDDVRMPPDWLEQLLAPFAQNDVMAVTGNVLPFELETSAQRLFEAYGGLGRGFERQVVDGRWFRQFLSAVPTWELGATANAAFRSTILTHPQIGLLDEALGAGTPTGCSEDTYLFYKILKANCTLVYEPSAIVFHRHRRDMAALRRQIYNYSKGHVAYQLTTLLRDRDRRAFVRLAVKLPQTYLQRTKHRLLGRSDYPVSLILLEILGNLAGPWALWRSRRRVARWNNGAAKCATKPPANTGTSVSRTPTPQPAANKGQSNHVTHST